MSDLGIRVVFVTSERLYDHQRQTIERVFGCQVANGYGGRDVGFIAHQCPQGGMHITAQDIIVEIVDSEGQVLPAGEIVITHLATADFPFIRYRIGDYGILLDTTCPCGRGSPLLKLTGAKIIEMIKTKSGKIFSAEIIDYINLALMKNPKVGIKQFRITQKNLKTFVIEVVPNDQFNDISKKIFTKLFTDQLGEKDLVLIFDLKNRIDPLPSGKRLYFKSEIS